MGPLGEAGLSIAQLAYAEAIRLLGARVGELVMAGVAVAGLLAGMAYLAVTLRLASVMERLRQF